MGDKDLPKIGDFVWKKSGKKYSPLGEVSDILINHKHPKKEMSVKIKDGGNSMYTINSLILGEKPDHWL